MSWSFQSTPPRGGSDRFHVRLGFAPNNFNPRPPAEGATANTANRLPVFTPLLQHILQEFASIRHIQNAENGKKLKIKCESPGGFVFAWGSH
nr:MAG TPA: peptidase [Caudoviricetes sp.]